MIEYFNSPSAIIAAALILVVPLTVADETRDIQLRRLYAPTDGELAGERKGRIFIYESLTERDIERAMEREFDRIQSMMFIRVPKTDESGTILKDEETGETLYEDDGC
jgi:hypothetical protein